jgi:hypothetical protein
MMQNNFFFQPSSPRQSQQFLHQNGFINAQGINVATTIDSNMAGG